MSEKEKPKLSQKELEAAARTTIFHSRPRILFDVDGVCANYTQMFISCVIASGVRAITHAWKHDQWDLSKALNLTDEEDDKVYSLLAVPGAADRINPLPGSVEGIKRIAKIAEVYFVTSPLDRCPTWVSDRDKWLQRLFGEELGKNVVHTKHKELVSGDMLVDDKPDHCKKWGKAWPLGKPVLWAERHRTDHEDEHLRTTSWDELLWNVQNLRAYAGLPRHS